MNSDDVIKFDHVSKEFSTNRRTMTIKDLFVYHERQNIKKRTVLDDISFSIKKGESLGIIGRNGSGKSTILKLLSKILRPDKGSITVNGKVACLIELGAGFHPDMTGRENIYINASIFGIPKHEVDKKIDKIIEFSGIGDYIDERVRNYSSGMYMRLAFSIAINVEAEVLLIDEILAVGDIKFQNKCLNWLNDFKAKGGTIVLVTHSIEQANMICDNVLWIDHGVTKEYGPANIVCENYYKTMNEDSDDSPI